MKAVDTADRSDDRIASDSSKGPTLYDHVVKPDIVAPGNQVRSVLNSASGTLYTQYSSTHVLTAYYAAGYTKAVSGAYFTLSGTSMATPVVSGAAALLMQQSPYLTPDQVKGRLMKTAYKAFPTSSTATDPATGQLYTSFYDIFTIGAGYLNVGAALANTDLMPSGSVTWGTSLAWGTTSMQGFSAIWGDGTNRTVDPASVAWAGVTGG